MCSLVSSTLRTFRRGITLVELVVVISIIGILVVLAIPLVLYGVKTMVFVPRALLVNRAATEVMHQIVEGGIGTLSPPVLQGLRHAQQQDDGEAAIWLGHDQCVGFVTSNGQHIYIRLQGNIMKRSILPSLPGCPVSGCPVLGTEEDIPYDALGSVLIMPTGDTFWYYREDGSIISSPVPGCPISETIRRVEIRFAAQTGDGDFDHGHARQDMLSSVAIRIP